MASSPGFRWRPDPVVELRIGLIGAAKVAGFAIIEPAAKDARIAITAVASRDPARARAFADRHGIARVHAGYAELIADPAIDLVYIGTWPSSHAALAIAAAQARKPALVEKPFAMTAEEARACASAADANGVRIFEAMHSRHHRLFARIVDIVQGGAIGAVETIEGVFAETIARRPGEFRWRADDGGGALMDLGVYPLAWLRGVLGTEPRVASARMTMVDGVDVETVAELRFPGGARGHIRAGMQASGMNRLVVVGSRGRLTVQNPLVPQKGHRLTLDTGPGATIETVEAPTSFEAQLEAVRATLIDGAPFPLPREDYVASMEAIDAVRAAARLSETN